MLNTTLSALREVWEYVDSRVRTFLLVILIYIPGLLILVAISFNALWPLVAFITVVAVLGLLWAMTVGRNYVTTAIIASGAISRRVEALWRRILGMITYVVLLGIYLTVVPVATDWNTRGSVLFLVLAFLGIMTGFGSRSFVGFLVGMISLTIVAGLSYWYVAVIPSEGGPIGIIREVTRIPGPLELCENQPDVVYPQWDANQVVIQLDGRWDCYGPQVFIPQYATAHDLTFVGYPTGLDAQGKVQCATESQMESEGIHQSVHYEWTLGDGTSGTSVSGDAGKVHEPSRAMPRFRGVGCIQLTLQERTSD